MTKKERIVTKAKELVAEYQPKYVMCGDTTFVAIINAFRSEGIEIFTPGRAGKDF